MTEAIQIALINLVAHVVIGAVSITTAVIALRTRQHLGHLHRQLNSHQELLLRAREELARAAGRLEGIATERERQAAERESGERWERDG